MHDFAEIDLKDLIMALLHKLWLIVLCAVLGGLLAFAYTANFITPMYRASVTIYVNNLSSQAVQSVDYISAGNLATSQQLVNTYVNIIKSRTVLEKVVEEADLEVSADAIRGMMSAKSVDETEIFEVYISNADPVLAAEIANAVAKVAPAEIANIVEGSSTKVIDYATVPQSYYTPNYRQNTFLGCCVGAVLAVVLVILFTMMDTSIKDEADLEQMFELPVLGSIPSFAAKHRGKSRGGRYGRAYAYGNRTAGKE